MEIAYLRKSLFLQRFHYVRQNQNRRRRRQHHQFSGLGEIRADFDDVRSGQAKKRIELIQIHCPFGIRCQQNRDFFREVAAVQSLQGIERLFVRAFVLLRDWDEESCRRRSL